MAGWSIGDGIPDRVAFFATEGDTRAAVYGTVMDPDGVTTFTDVGAVQPWWVTVLAALSGVGAGLLGRLAAGWAASRAARRSPTGRAGVRELTVRQLLISTSIGPAGARSATRRRGARLSVSPDMRSTGSTAAPGSCDDEA